MPLPLVAVLHYTRQPSVGTCAVDCGARCCRSPGHVVVTEVEAQLLRALDKRGRVRFMQHDRRGMLVMNFKGTACEFLDQGSNLCSIYERRPRGCREFPIKPYANCLVWPKQEEVALATG